MRRVQLPMSYSCSVVQNFEYLIVERLFIHGSYASSTFYQNFRKEIFTLFNENKLYFQIQQPVPYEIFHTKMPEIP